MGVIECATKSEEAADNQDNTFNLTAPDGFVLGVTCEKSAMSGLSGAEATKGACYGSEESFRSSTFQVYGWTTDGEIIYTNETVSYKDGQWKPATAKAWPYKASLNFIAAHAGSGFEFSGIASQSMNFSYAVPESAANHDDLMLAYYSGAGSSGVASLTFTHALAGVCFSTGSMEGVTSIDEISLEGVYSSGTCAVVKQSGPTYTWTPSGSRTVKSSGTIAAANFSSLGTTAGYIFDLIPQSSTAQSITLNVKLTIGSEQKTFSVALPAFSWTAGEKYTYTLKYDGAKVGVSVDDSVSGATKSNLVIANTGKVDAYIRVCLAGAYYADGEFYANWTDSQGTFTGLDTTNWFKHTDGFWYYKNPVDKATDDTHPTEVPNKLFTDYTTASWTGIEDGTKLQLSVLVQAVEYDSSKAKVTAAWGSDVAALLNTK